MTRILWQLTMALALQVAVGMVPNGGVGLKKSRHLSEKKREKETAPEWQAWMWASMALGAVGAMGAYGARRFVQQQRENAFELLPEHDDERKVAAACKDDSRELLVDPRVGEINSLGFLDILQRHKTVMLVKGVVGIGFRTIDFGLDVRTGTKFYADGDVWWCGILFAVILVSPLSQYLYIKYQRGKAANALAYLVPGSVKHLQREITNMRFIAKLPQLSLYRNVHKAVATGTLNEILAGLECGLESLPQAILQLRAYAVKGGDWVNRLSIAFSLFGVVVGVVLGLKAVLTSSKQQGTEIYDTEVELAVNAGQSVDLQGRHMDEQTVDAVLWLAENDRDLCTWNWSASPVMNDALLRRFTQQCPHLAEIYLKGCKDITDASIQELAQRCKDLTMVNLFECKQITDASVKELAKNCKNLTSIDLVNCNKITDDGVKELAKNCTRLTDVNLGGCYNITADAVKELATNCKHLTHINLGGCKQITDDAVKELAEQCRNLKKVTVFGVVNPNLQEQYPKIEWE